MLSQVKLIYIELNHTLTEKEKLVFKRITLEF